MDRDNPDKQNCSDSVDELLAGLAPPNGWQPNADRAFTLFSARRAKQRNFMARLLAAEVSLRVWLWGAAVAAAACACLLAFPTSRDLVQRLWTGRSDARMVYVGQVYADLETLKDTQVAADFTLKDAQGHDVHLSDYKGKVVLINFWASWCPPCQQEIPWLVEFDQKYRGKGLVVIGIAMDEDGWMTLEPYLREKDVNYTVVTGDDATAEEYGMYSLPMTFLIDREGKISAVSSGIVNRDECEKEIQRLLGS